jgi:prepilin-type processing-associated H-X9-DG protein
VYVNDFPKDKYYSQFSVARRCARLWGFSLGWSWPEGGDRRRWISKEAARWGSFPHARGQFMGRFAIDRHNGGINIGYVDGHAARVTVKGLWAANWCKDFVPNYNVKLPAK